MQRSQPDIGNTSTGEKAARQQNVLNQQIDPVGYWIKAQRAMDRGQAAVIEIDGRRIAQSEADEQQPRKSRLSV